MPDDAAWSLIVASQREQITDLESRLAASHAEGMRAHDERVCWQKRTLRLAVQLRHMADELLSGE